MRRIAFYQCPVLLCCLGFRAFGGSMTYQVTQNPGACREVHLGQLTKPPEIKSYDDVSAAGNCHIELRSASETTLYLAAACQYDTPRSQTFPLTKEKYAVDLSAPDKVRRIDEQVWQSGKPVPWEGFIGEAVPNHPSDRGISYKGRVFEKSGPKWSGVGAPPVGAVASQGGSHIAINSWDGFDIEYDFLDPTTGLRRDKVKGQFWTDIYDSGSGERLIQIQGTFNGVGPNMFLWPARWYGSRYFVMPVGRTALLGNYNLRRLLICDTDVAQRMNGSGFKERK